MAWWDTKAGREQRAVIEAEAEFGRLMGDPDPTYGTHGVERSIVHTRQDMILLVSHLSSLSSQLRYANIILSAIALLICYNIFG